jgi:transposase
MRYVKVEDKEKAIEELEQIIKNHKSHRIRDRARAIKLSLREYKVTQIEEILETTNTAIYRWFNRYEANGALGLEDKGSRGRKAKLKDKKN